jgi:hypothetical protein
MEKLRKITIDRYGPDTDDAEISTILNSQHPPLHSTGIPQDKGDDIWEPESKDHGDA